MSRLHIFNAGPGVLPGEVTDSAAEAVRGFAGTGMSLLTVSHRSKEWGEVMEETLCLWRELMDLPEEYSVVLVGGGASLQFLLVAMNLLERRAGYLDTGVWAHKALVEAQGIGNAYAVASSEDRGYTYIPKGYDIPSDLDYFHVTSCNTVYGTQLQGDMACPVPLVADMSSDILSRRIDVERYAVIYGGAQKNAGTAGVSFAIVRRDVLGRVSRHIPTLLDYRTYIGHGSMFNTPPVFPIFVMNRTLRWLKSIGGVDAVEKVNRRKAAALYAALDSSRVFHPKAAVEDRSMMNVTFEMAPGYERLEEDFIRYARERDIVGIKGHRFAGGFRASLYNACTEQDVAALAEAIKLFDKVNR